MNILQPPSLWVFQNSFASSPAQAGPVPRLHPPGGWTKWGGCKNAGCTYFFCRKNWESQGLSVKQHLSHLNSSYFCFACTQTWPFLSKKTSARAHPLGFHYAPIIHFDPHDMDINVKFNLSSTKTDLARYWKTCYTHWIYIYSIISLFISISISLSVSISIHLSIHTIQSEYTLVFPPSCWVLCTILAGWARLSIGHLGLIGQHLSGEIHGTMMDYGLFIG